MRLRELNKNYLFTMVQAVYKFEASLVSMPDLLSEEHLMDFYAMYMGYESWKHI